MEPVSGEVKRKFTSSKKDGFFNCPYSGCGRKFPSKGGLHGHIARRHQLGKQNQTETQPARPYEPPSRPQTAAPARSSGGVGTGGESLADREQRLAERLRALQKLEEDVLQMDSRPATSAGRRKATTGSKITEALVRKASLVDFQSLEELEMLNLRDQGLTEFRTRSELDFERLGCVTTLTLSHNQLLDIQDVGLHFSQLLELNLSFNRIQDITPLSRCDRLERLWLNGNQVVLIEALAKMGRLHTLSLFNNKIHSPDTVLDILGDLPKLEELSLDHNPCVFKDPGLKHALIYKLELNSYDDEAVTDFDRELASQYVRDNGLAAALTKRSAPALRIRPATTRPRREAADEAFSADFDTEKRVRFMDDGVPSEEVERLKKENEDLKFQLFKQQDYQELKSQNTRLKAEAANLFILEQENEDLRQEIASLKRLNKADRQDRLEQENQQLLAECGKLRVKYEKLQEAYDALDMTKWEEKLQAIAKMRARPAPPLDTYDFSARPQTAAAGGRREQPAPAEVDEELSLLDAEMKAMLKRNEQSLAELHSEFKSLSLMTDEPTFRIRQSKTRSGALQPKNK